MAVPAASFVVSAAIAAVLTTVVSMMSATLTTACQHLDKMLYLFFSSLTVLLHLSDEVQGLTCQRMVGVDGDAVVLNLHHLGHKLMVFNVVHRNDGSLEDMLVVKFAVDAEYLASQFMGTFWHIGTESLFRLEGEVELASLFYANEVLFEIIEGDAVSGDELEGTVGARLLLQ